MKLLTGERIGESATGRVQQAVRVPGRRLSRRLAIAIGGLAVLLRREPETTLEELRAALLATGYVWSAEGKLALAGDRPALLAEFDRLIKLYGGDANAAELLL